MGLDVMILVFGTLNFKPAFSLSSFTLIKRLFSSSSLSAIRVVSSSYLRLLIFLPAILIPAYDSFSRAVCVMYSAQKLNKQGDNTQRRRTRALCGAPDNEVGQCFFNHWLSLDFKTGDWLGLEGVGVGESVTFQVFKRFSYHSFSFLKISALNYHCTFGNLFWSLCLWNLKDIFKWYDQEYFCNKRCKDISTLLLCKWFSAHLQPLR